MEQSSSCLSLKSKLDTLSSQFRINEKYIEQYIPIFTQIQISEALDNGLRGKERKQNAIFQQKKFEALVHSLREETKSSSFAKKINTIYDIVDPIMQKLKQVYLGQQKDTSNKM